MHRSIISLSQNFFDYLLFIIDTILHRGNNGINHISAPRGRERYYHSFRNISPRWNIKWTIKRPELKIFVLIRIIVIIIIGTDVIISSYIRESFVIFT